MRWLSRKVSVLKKSTVKTVNTTNVIASWITFNCHRLNGPPLPSKPRRLAGTWKIYSKKAIPQLIRIMAKSPRLLNQLICLNFRCPYHAIVIKLLDSNKRKIVRKPLFIGFGPSQEKSQERLFKSIPGSSNLSKTVIAYIET